MNGIEQQDRIRRIREEVSRIMHLHYVENDIEGVIASFAPDFSWFGAGEEQYAAGYEEAVRFFRRFHNAIPQCHITGEEYNVIEAAPDMFVCSGRMWIETDTDARMLVKVHQRVTFVFRWEGDRPLCIHIHCSNPYMEMVEDELFPDKIGKQSYDYVQEHIHRLEEEMKQRNRQLAVIMASVPGGLKISMDDEMYSFAYVSEEAAALFGYTVEEFMEATGGTAVGTVYPPDLPKTLAGCAEAFKDGGLSYALKYRVRCKDGSLKWILDSGRKSKDENGNTLINSLYLDITRSEQDAQEILRQKKLLNSIFDTVSSGILRFLKKDGVYDLTLINPAAVRLLGYEEGEVYERDWKEGVADTVVDEDRPLIKESYRRLHQAGDSADIEYRVRWQDGSIHWMRGSNSIVSVSEDSQVIQRIFYDVTESRALQEQLNREQEMYRLAMESSSDAMYEYTADNDTFVIYEPKRDESGKNGVEKTEFPQYQKLLQEGKTVHPADAQTVRDNICKGRAEVFEARFHIGDVPDQKEYWWYRVTGKVINLPGGTYRVVGTLRNIHEEKTTLTANMEELHMNQSALQAISGAYSSIYFIDLKEDRYYGVRLPDMDIEYDFSRAGCFSKEMRNYIMKSVVENDRGKMWKMTVPENLEESLKNINDSTGLEYCETTGGIKRWLRVDYHLVSKEDGRIRNIIMAYRNVTEERKRELEHIREEELAKKALEEAFEAARQANLAKSDFLSRMSHDIRTPMNAVMGMLTIAEKNLGDSDKLEDCLAKIRLSSEHLLSLINEVLDMSKIESGNVGLNEAPFNIRETLTGAVEMMRQESDGKQQHLQLQMGQLVHEDVVGDMVRVQQILLNLLSNAVKYTQEGGKIRVEMKEMLPSAGGLSCYQIIVEDNGIGISEAFKEKLFQPFERAEDSRVSKVQGTGLGMSITQNLVRMMNGAIEVESRINEGTRFTVTVCLKLCDGLRKEGRTRTAGGDRVSLSGRWNILLAEDNDLNREIAKELLEMENIHVEEAVNGKEAVEKFCCSPEGYYHLILMDIQMPVMNGYDAARAIRALKRPDADTIPVIALTANAFADDIYRARQAGMNAHLAKPLDMAQVMQVLKEWLEKPE